MDNSGDGGGDKKEIFADLAAKLAAGPPKKPVGLVKKDAKGYDDMKKEEAEASEAAQQKLGDLMKEAVGQEKD